MIYRWSESLCFHGKSVLNLSEAIYLRLQKKCSTESYSSQLWSGQYCTKAVWRSYRGIQESRQIFPTVLGEVIDA